VSTDFSRDELQAAYLAGLLQDDDRIFVGANLHVPRAGALLAHLTHAPNMQLSIGLISTNLLHADRLEPTKFSTDYRVSRWAEAVVIHNDIFDRPEYCADVFFIGGLQIDRYGNTNLIGIKGPDGKLAVRGPGPLGTTTMAHYAKRFYIYAQHHAPATFVSKVDYISALGYGDGGGYRESLGLNQYNDGPICVVTPLGILDFETPDNRMRLRHVHPGVTVEEVQEQTGFELEIAEGISETPAPTAAQLELLRETIDVEGLLR
jgi:glutaconate CoA-transferase subunit B